VHVSSRVVRVSVILTSAAALIAAAACDDSSSPTFSGPVVNSVEISPHELTLARGVIDTINIDTTVTDSTGTRDTVITVYDSTAGETGQLTAILKDAGGNVVDDSIVPPQETTGWTTTDPSVAAPDVSGNVQAGYAAGNATVYGSIGSSATAVDSSAVTVTEPDLAILKKAAAKRLARIARHSTSR